MLALYTMQQDHVPVCRRMRSDWLRVRTARYVTVSPGLTDTATTEPGIGERSRLLVSSGTFSGMKEFNCAANLDRTRTLNYKQTPSIRNTGGRRHKAGLHESSFHRRHSVNRELIGLSAIKVQ